MGEGGVPRSRVIASLGAQDVGWELICSTSAIRYVCRVLFAEETKKDTDCPYYLASSSCECVRP